MVHIFITSDVRRKSGGIRPFSPTALRPNIMHRKQVIKQILPHKTHSFLFSKIKEVSVLSVKNKNTLKERFIPKKCETILRVGSVNRLAESDNTILC